MLLLRVAVCLWIAVVGVGDVCCSLLCIGVHCCFLFVVVCRVLSDVILLCVLWFVV